jgi:large subunit ribosomal protein L15
MKRGFTNIFKTQYTLVKLEDLNLLPEGTEVVPELLVQLGFIKNLRYPIKVLGNGELQVSLTVSAQKFTHSAIEKIEAAGGRVEVL